LVIASTVVACAVSIASQITGRVDLTPIGEEPDPDLDQEPDGKPLLTDRSRLARRPRPHLRIVRSNVRTACTSVEALRGEVHECNVAPAARVERRVRREETSSGEVSGQPGARPPGPRSGT
jgi:hypothetical protein